MANRSPGERTIINQWGPGESGGEDDEEQLQEHSTVISISDADPVEKDHPLWRRYQKIVLIGLVGALIIVTFAATLALLLTNGQNEPISQEYYHRPHQPDCLH